MEMFDIVRASYGYTDEYILDKTFTWLYNSVAFIQRRTYNDQVGQAVQVAKIFSKDSKIQYWDELQDGGGSEHVWIEDEEVVGDISNLGIGK